MIKAFIVPLFTTSVLTPRVFLLRTVFWLPFLFVLWYLLSAWLSWPALTLAQLILPLALPNLLEATEIRHYYLMVHTYLGAETYAELPAGFARFAPQFFANGQHYPFLLTVPINSLVYAYGLPVLVALTLATPSQWKQRLQMVILGFLLVTVIQVWGVVFNTANLLVLDLTDALATQAKLLWPILNESAVQALIALGYRIGFLIFPVVLPILLWAQFNPVLLHQLIHGRKPEVLNS